jgi:hypothetical protein
MNQNIADPHAVTIIAVSMDDLITAPEASGIDRDYSSHRPQKVPHCVRCRYHLWDAPEIVISMVRRLLRRTQSARSHEGEYYAAMERGVDDTQPMTGEQATMLKRLTQAAYELDAFKPNLTRAEADLRIATLTAKLKLLDGPPHTL